MPGISIQPTVSGFCACSSLKATRCTRSSSTPSSVPSPSSSADCSCPSSSGISAITYCCSSSYSSVPALYSRNIWESCQMLTPRAATQTHSTIISGTGILFFFRPLAIALLPPHLFLNSSRLSRKKPDQNSPSSEIQTGSAADSSSSVQTARLQPLSPRSYWRIKKAAGL